MTDIPNRTQVQVSGAVEGGAPADAAAPQLAAIQQAYEETKASIIDPTHEPLNWVYDPDDPRLHTEEIDLDAVLPPVPHDETPPTEAMSVAAQQLAEQQLAEEAARPAHASTRPDSVIRRWWRAFWTP